MAFLSRETLQHWVADFIEARSAGEDIRVALQDGSDGENTGLVLVPLENAPNAVWIEPRDTGDELSWHVFIEPANDTIELTSFELNALTHELQIAAELCAFLQERSLGHYEPAAEASPSTSATE